MNWIVKYAIVKLDRGHGQVLEVLDDKHKAIEKAKRLSLTCKDICVEERRYSNAWNLRWGITFDSSFCWASWV